MQMKKLYIYIYIYKWATPSCAPMLAQIQSHFCPKSTLLFTWIHLCFALETIKWFEVCSKYGIMGPVLSSWAELKGKHKFKGPYHVILAEASKNMYIWVPFLSLKFHPSFLPSFLSSLLSNWSTIH